MAFSGYGFYLSSTAALLYFSYFTHNVVAWMKIKPFFSGSQPSFSPKICKWVTRIYLVTLGMSAPVICFEIVNNFRFFNNYSRLYESVRPYEPLMRDPWWVFSCLTLFHVIRKCYSLNTFKLIRRSPRFGILLIAMFFAIVFTVMDITASIVSSLSLTDGCVNPALRSVFQSTTDRHDRINPYWKIALVFKCLTDNIMLDDFKNVLQRLGAMQVDGSTAMLPNSLNLTPDEKWELGKPTQVEDTNNPSARLTSERAPSISGRMLDDNELLDNFGHGRRKESMETHFVGNASMKIQRLPKLPLSQINSRNEDYMDC
jgi:hypothetical protein